MARRAHPDEPVLIRVVIANNQSLSGAVDLYDLVPVGISMPAAWTVADITFAAAPFNPHTNLAATAVTYVPLYDDTGAEVTVSGPAASRYLALSDNVQGNLAACRWLKVRSGTSGAAVVQLAERVIHLACRRV